MDPLNRALATEAALKERLREIYGDEIDEQTLLDTVEGENDLVEIICRVYRQALADDAMVEGIREFELQPVEAR